MQPDILDALEDIVEHIEYILEDIDGVTWAFFQEHRRTQQLVIYNIMIIGEAANRIAKIDRSVLQEFPGLALSVPTRNALIHGYDVVDEAVVWRIASELVSPLRDQILDYISDADSRE
jgi:uncharacterized protein with HEPN domain